ncbi:hypothetical protein Moror_5810, partial [Moniliophthora roreri MCA 2997]
CSQSLWIPASRMQPSLNSAPRKNVRISLLYAGFDTQRALRGRWTFLRYPWFAIPPRECPALKSHSRNIIISSDVFSRCVQGAPDGDGPMNVPIVPTFPTANVDPPTLS